MQNIYNQGMLRYIKCLVATDITGTMPWAESEKVHLYVKPYGNCLLFSLFNNTFSTEQVTQHQM